LFTFHALRSEFTLPACLKVWYIEVTEVVFHVLKPNPANFVANKNVPSNVVTLATFHPLRSEFISEAK